MEKRQELARRIRENGGLTAKCRKFSLNGQPSYDGIYIPPDVWTVRFIADPDLHGVVENEKTHTITVYDSFKGELPFAKHLYNGEYDEEFIGLHRQKAYSPEEKEKWGKPCTDPVFCFHFSIFDGCIYDAQGIIVIDYGQV